MARKFFTLHTGSSMLLGHKTSEPYGFSLGHFRVWLKPIGIRYWPFGFDFFWGSNGRIYLTISLLLFWVDLSWRRNNYHWPDFNTPAKEDDA